MKQTRNYLKKLTMFFLALSLLSCSAEKLVKVNTLGDLPMGIMAKDAPKADKYPEHDAVILYENQETDVDLLAGIGFESYQLMHRVMKIYKNPDSFKKVTLYFGDDDEIESFSARSIDPDGKVTNLGENDVYIQDISKKAKDYNNKNRAITFLFPAVKKGSIIELKVNRISRGAYIVKPWVVQSFVPVLYTRFQMSMPKFLTDNKEINMNWQYKPYNMKALPEPKVEEGLGEWADRTYTWELRDIPAFEFEPSAGSLLRDIQYVNYYVSGWHTWQGVAKWVKKSYLKKILKPDEKVKEKAEELTKGAKTELEKIEKLYKFAQEITYDATHNYFGRGQQPERPIKVIEKGYGDCKDKSVLLVALLNAVGIDAAPALVLTADVGETDPKMPGLMFNHMIVRAYPKEGKPIWLDPVVVRAPVKFVSSSIQGQYALVTKMGKKGKLIKIPTEPVESNLVDKKVSIVLDKSGISTVKAKYTFKGGNNVAFRNLFGDLSAKKKIKAIKYLLLNGRLFDATVENIKHTDPYDMGETFSLEFTVKNAHLLSKVGDVHALSLAPLGDESMSGLKWLVEEKRNLPIRHIPRILVTGELEITLPEGFEAPYLPKDLTVENKEEGNFIKRNVSSENGKIVIKSEYRSVKSQLPKEKYSMLRKLSGMMRDNSVSSIIIKGEVENKTVAAEKEESVSAK